MVNPFQVETLAPDSPFCDREEHLDRLISCAHSHANVILHSPRRCGKTSLALRAQAMLRNKGYVTVYSQLFGVDSVADAVQRMARDVLEAVHARESLLDKGRRFLKTFASLRPVFKPGEDGMTVGVELAREDPLELLDRLWRDFGEFVATSGYSVNVVLDEFQEITRLKETGQIEGVMRGRIQGLKASFFFLGSRRGILLGLFSDRKRPFYQSALPMQLGPLPREDTVAFLETQFAGAGKSCPGVVGAMIAGHSACHPYYMQRLAREVFEISGVQATQQDVRQAMVHVLDTERYVFEAMLARLTTPQIRLLRTLAHGPAELLSREFLNRCGLAPSNVQYARERLREDDLIEKRDDGAWQVVDPVFASWLRKLYAGD